MRRKTYYRHPTIKVIAVRPLPILAASAIPVSENGEADAKANNTYFIEEEEENDFYQTTY